MNKVARWLGDVPFLSMNGYTKEKDDWVEATVNVDGKFIIKSPRRWKEIQAVDMVELTGEQAVSLAKWMKEWVLDGLDKEEEEQ